MKIKYTSLLTILLFCNFFLSYGQSSDQNYILTSEYLETVLVDDDFDSSFGGWLENGSVNYSLDNGRLKANVNSNWEGVKNPLKGFKTIAGKTLKVKINFNKGNTTSNVRLYLEERNPSGGLVNYNVRTNNLQTGIHEYTLDMINTGNTIIFRIDKDDTNTGVETYFYIDYVSLQIDTNTNIDKLDNITYFDGFGKAKQSIAIRQSPNEKDLVQHIEYDEFGRGDKQYLPLPSTQNTGNYISNAKTQTEAYYQNAFADQHPFAEIRYDDSPLNRKLEAAAPGNTWQLLESSDSDHTTKYDYATNASNEVYRIDINEQTPDIPLYLNQYSSHKLVKNTIKNENWSPSDGLLNTKEVFTDKNGKKIAEFNYEDVSGSVKKLSTYYVYDDAQNLRYVLPPKTLEYQCNSDSGVISDLTFNGHVSAPNTVDLVASNSITLNGGFAVDLGAAFSASIANSGTCGIVDNNTPCTGTYTKSFPHSVFSPDNVGRYGTVDVIITPYSIRLELDTFSFYYNNPQSPPQYLINETPQDIQAPCDIPDIFFGPVLGAITAEIKDGKLKFNNPYDEEINGFVDVYAPAISFTESLSSFSDFYTPKLSQAMLDDIAFQYEYDQYNRQTAQKVPGKGWEYTVYDQLDRPVLIQDANLKSQNKWMFNAYDIFGRIVYTGLYTNSASREAIQSQIDNFIFSGSNKANVETRTSTTNTIGGISMNYSNNAFPNNNLEILTVNYFDDYNFTDTDLPSIPTVVLGQNVTDRTRGLLTATWTKTLGASSWSKDYTFYDDKGRVIYMHDKNHLGGFSKNESKLDFRGKIELSVTTHRRTTSGSVLTVEDSFEYDHAERPLNHFQTINSQAQELITSNAYSELGQLLTKNIGGTAANPLQTVDYAYNVRGWLTHFNDPDNLGSDMFAYALTYDTPIEGSGLVSDNYNGNIKQIIWRSAHGGGLKKSYSLEYDKLNRFKASYYRENNSLTGGVGKFSTQYVNYDANGNITSLGRTGQTGSTIDILSYGYDSGNQLKSMEDWSFNSNGFNNGSSGINTQDYFYDANGNLIKDNNKGITDIEYNHLDLVERVTFSNGNKIEFDYSADGTKLQMRNIISGATVTTKDYLDGFQYTNSQLQFFPTTEGYATKDGSTYKYVYILRDHLGNNRVSFSDTNGDLDILSNEIISNTDYYVMGLTHQGEFISSFASNYNYKYHSKELLTFTGYNMYDFGSRMYDAAVGRWFNTDPQNQFWSPYLAMGNNFIIVNDPSGEWAIIDDIIAVVVGGVVNVVANWDNITSGDGSFWEKFGRGAAYFGIGAAAGEATLYGGPLAGGAVLGLGNSAYTQYLQNGEVDLGQTLFDGVIGTATAGIGSKVSPLIQPYTDKLFSNVSNKIASKYLSDATSNVISGLGLSTTTGLLQGQSLEDSFSNAVEGIPQSLAISAIGTTGSVLGQKYHDNKRDKAIKELEKELNQKQQLKLNPSLHDELIPSNTKYDAGAHALADEIGGLPQVEFRDGPHANREFDAVSQTTIGQHKPAIKNNFGQSFKKQARATFEAARDTGRSVIYRFDSQPGPKVIDKLFQYGKEYGVNIEIRWR